MLSDGAVLNATLLAEVVRQGYTRIPVYRGANRNEIVGLLIVKGTVGDATRCVHASRQT